MSIPTIDEARTPFEVYAAREYDLLYARKCEQVTADEYFAAKRLAYDIYVVSTKAPS